MTSSNEIANFSVQFTAENETGQAASAALLNLNAGRDSVLAYFENTWSLTETLFSALVNDEAFYRRAYHKLRHPMVFYYAHPASLYVNKLLVSGLIKEPVNKEFELLFESGVDEMTWDQLHEGKRDIWPPMDQVRDYRRQVYDLIRDLIANHPALAEPINQERQTWALVMAFEHERIHLETSSVLMRELPSELLKVPDAWPPFFSVSEHQVYQPQSGKDYPENELLELPAAEPALGKPRAWPSFGWDIEYGREIRSYAPFRTSRFLISNGEFFEFVRAGGYENPEYWSDSGWAWRQFRNVKWPTFWIQDGPSGSHRYRLRSTFEELPMQWDWPAVVNYYEAKAYCAWLTGQKGCTDRPFRLLTEAEHHGIRDCALADAVDWHPADNNCLALDAVMQMGRAVACNHNLRYGGESPVNALPANAKGIHDSFGNVWQWCEDAFHPLDGFEIHPYYSDFSSPCFDDAHQMILGGSFISTGDEASIWARFHFRPHFFQHAGFRVVQDMGSAAKKADKYDTDAVLDQYLLFHFGSREEQKDQQLSARLGHPEVGNLVQRTVELILEFTQGKNAVLDLGCAVGGASFELARSFERVLGLDYSAAFIDAAERLRRTGELGYRRWETGRHSSPLLVHLDADIDRGRTSFVQGDAANLREQAQVDAAGPYDSVLLSNLLCRLSDPQQCLRQFVDSDRYIGSGGILVIASPNTWMQQFTDPERFLDGADSAATLSALSRLLPGFSLQHEEDLPFIIREHRRKYEYIISQVSVWQKD